MADETTDQRLADAATRADAVQTDEPTAIMLQLWVVIASYLQAIANAKTEGA